MLRPFKLSAAFPRFTKTMSGSIYYSHTQKHTHTTDFLASCHLPVATLNTIDQTATQGHALGERGGEILRKDNDKCFYVFCIDTPGAAREYYGSWRHLPAHQQLLVVDPAVYRAVPELRVIESVQLRAKSIFVKELLQVQRPITLPQPPSMHANTHARTHARARTHTHTHTHTHTGDGHEVGALLSRAAEGLSSNGPRLNLKRTGCPTLTQARSGMRDAGEVNSPSRKGEFTRTST